MSYKTKIATNIKTLRKNNHLTQQELATSIDVSKQLISFYERGERKPGTLILIKLADYFNVSIDFLVGRSDE